MENFLIKLWKLGTSVIFFPPCLTSFLLSWSTLFFLPTGIPAGSHAEKSPFPPSASTPWASGFTEPRSLFMPSLHSGEEISFQEASWSHNSVTETSCMLQTIALESLPYAHVLHQESVAFPHNSHSPCLQVCCLRTTGLFPWLWGLTAKSFDALSSHCAPPPGVQPWSNRPRTALKLWRPLPKRFSEGKWSEDDQRRERNTIFFLGKWETPYSAMASLFFKSKTFLRYNNYNQSLIFIAHWSL